MPSTEGTCATGAIWTVWTTATATTAAVDCRGGSDAPTITSDTSTAVVTWGNWNIPYEYRVSRPATDGEQREIRRKREEAKRKSEQLLIRHLSPQQRRTFRKEGHFTVISSRGERVRIRCNTLYGNVEELHGNGRVRRRLCAHPLFVPRNDAFLAQKLAIETDHDAFERVANVHPLAG